ncbi:MAG: DUF5063 domain-containing protein [Chromatiales bacterium]|jgi:hypothetical protein
MSHELDEMASVARAYCELIEAADQGNGSWLAKLADLLPRLHAAIKRLDPPADKSEHTLVADLDARFELFSHLRELLGDRDGYWMEFDVSSEEQQMSGSLADDLTDIYCELKHGLRLLERDPAEPLNALDGWRRGFKMHWGQHLVDAERHLYTLEARGRLAS